jgi:predicted small lipoprotein YifL
MIAPVQTDSAMTRTRRRSAARIAAPLALAVLVALAGCGRKGPLEPPGAVEEPATQPTVFGTSPPPPPEQQAPPPADDPFILDAII